MSTATYIIAKCLNRLISPYVPMTYSLNSTTDFNDIISTADSQGEIASLDVNNLFTNIPLEETIDIIMDMVYRSDKTPLPIPENIMRDMLKTCTTKAPFRCQRGQIYRQTDGVYMGSPLGVLFAEAYMAEVQLKPVMATLFRTIRLLKVVLNRRNECTWASNAHHRIDNNRF